MFNQSNDHIWRFNTARFSVILDCDWEENPDFSFDETGETEDKCRRGVWSCVCFRVRVLLDGEEIAADFLGNSIYADVCDFAREHLGCRTAGYGSYFPDMVREAISEARAEIRRRVDTAPRLRAVQR